MTTIVQTFDKDFVHRIMRDPDVYPFIGDDSSPKDPMAFDASDYLSNCICLKVMDESHPVGVFVFFIGEDGYELHTMLTKLCRGSAAVRAAKEAIAWIFDNTDCKEIVSFALSDAPATTWFAKMIGLIETSRQLHANTRNNLPVEIIFYSMPRPSQ
jgi:Protein of unknown function (DUF2824)